MMCVFCLMLLCCLPVVNVSTVCMWHSTASLANHVLLLLLPVNGRFSRCQPEAWHRGRTSVFAGELSLFCARPTADG